MINNKTIKTLSLLAVATFSLSACSVDLSSEDRSTLTRHDVRDIVCNMVDKEALKDKRDCE